MLAIVIFKKRGIACGNVPLPPPPPLPPSLPPFLPPSPTHMDTRKYI